MQSTLKNALRPICEVALALATYSHGVQRTVNGVTLRVDARTRFFFPTTYDVGVSDLLLATLKPGDECWNIGANVGVHVLQMAAHVGPTGRVFAFEPNPHAAALLQRNVALNGYSDRVSIIRAAIGQHSGTTDFFIAGADPMGRPQRPNPLLGRTSRIQVSVLTLDRFLAQRNCKPQCLVIDIEGWEIGALLGAHDVLQFEPLPLLVLELHPDAWSWSGHSREQLVHLIERHRLEPIPLSGQSDVLGEHGLVRLRCAETPDPSLQRTALA